MTNTPRPAQGRPLGIGSGETLSDTPQKPKFQPAAYRASPRRNQGKRPTSQQLNAARMWLSPNLAGGWR